MATPEEVLDSVLKFVGGFAHLDPTGIDPSQKLSDPPLSFDDNQLALLATSLRAYAKSLNDAATVTAADTRKDGQSAKGLASLIVLRTSA